VISLKDRWIGTYSIGLTITGKLGCPNNNNNKKKKLKPIWTLYGFTMLDL
jgi:hypothetical protein